MAGVGEGREKETGWMGEVRVVGAVVGKEGKGFLEEEGGGFVDGGIEKAIVL